jgi:hypothetical protein
MAVWLTVTLIVVGFGGAPVRKTDFGTADALASETYLEFAGISPSTAGIEVKSTAISLSIWAQNGAEGQLQRDTVFAIDEMSAEGGLEIRFKRHAAIYHIDRGDLRLADWFSLLRESQMQGTSVCFGYEDEGQRLIYVQADDGTCN